METHKRILQNDLFYVTHLTDEKKDVTDAASFRVNDAAGLEYYIRNMAVSDETSGVMRTYIVRSCNDDTAVAYFSLKAGLISINEIKTEDGIVFDTLPGVEIADYAINSEFIDAYPYLKGVGAVVFSDFIVPLILKAAEYIGIKVIYIFALPVERLIKRYRDYGFSRLDQQAEDELHKRVKPFYDDGCIFMYQMLK